MSMKAVYTASATSVGGRRGHVKSSDGIIDLDLKIPTAMGGDGGSYSNPEQLFAAGFAACFNGAFELAARLRKLDATGSAVTANVSIGKDDAGLNRLAVELIVKAPGIDKKTALELANEANDRICPYSAAVRGNVEVKLSIA